MGCIFTFVCDIHEFGPNILESACKFTFPISPCVSVFSGVFGTLHNSERKRKLKYLFTSPVAQGISPIYFQRILISLEIMSILLIPLILLILLNSHMKAVKGKRPLTIHVSNTPFYFFMNQTKISNCVMTSFIFMTILNAYNLNNNSLTCVVCCFLWEFNWREHWFVISAFNLQIRQDFLSIFTLLCTSWMNAGSALLWFEAVSFISIVLCSLLTELPKEPITTLISLYKSKNRNMIQK